jgi:acyl dehydratase
MVPPGLRLVEDLRYRAAMPLNDSLKGKRYEEIHLTVERDDVLRFADAIGEGDPVFRDPESARAAGHPDQLAPPTFVTKMQIMASALVIVDQDLGLDYSRVVHGEQEYEWFRPIVVGDVLTATPRISDIYAKKSNEYLIIEAEIRDAAGEVVVVSRATLLSRGTGEG